MRYLKTFERVQEVDLVENSRWDSYVKELFNEYFKIYNQSDECPYESDVIDFFNELDDEIGDSDSIEIYKVQRRHSQGLIFYGLAKAYGPNHACVKVSIGIGDAVVIHESVEAYVIEEEEIQSKIKELEEEIKEWKKIY